MRRFVVVVDGEVVVVVVGRWQGRCRRALEDLLHRRSPAGIAEEIRQWVPSNDLDDRDKNQSEHKYPDDHASDQRPRQPGWRQRRVRQGGDLIIFRLLRIREPEPRWKRSFRAPRSLKPACVLVTPAALVPPNRRRSFEPSGTRTTTCLTAVLVRSIDWKISTVPMVAAMEPIATPTMVPFTPNMEAMNAERTAPPAEARICR